ncbi:MAG: hypothetical protein JW934_08795 [Anaerolineae bacterium]|nr:hypothetical protein [Anaerolineae bacterium]
MNEPIKPLCAKRYGPRWGLTLLGLGLFIALIIGIDSSLLCAISAFVPIALLGILFWNIGLLKMDTNGIEYCQWPKRGRIAWEEIECIDINNVGYVFRGSNKELSIPSFSSISGGDVSKMQELLNAQIVQRNWQLTDAFKTLAKEWLDGTNVVGLEEDC